jgi:hypothetical protein
MVWREGEEAFVMKMGFDLKRAFATVTAFAVTALPFAKGSPSQMANLPTDEAAVEADIPEFSSQNEEVAQFNANADNMTGQGDTTTKRTYAGMVEFGGSGRAETYSGKNSAMAFYIRGGTESKSDADRYAQGLQKFIDQFIDDHPEYGDSLKNYAIFYHNDVTGGGTDIETLSMGDDMPTASGKEWDSYTTFKADFKRKAEIHIAKLREKGLQPAGPVGMN